jgi:GT2 family glycosyltransferase
LSPVDTAKEHSTPSAAVIICAYDPRRWDDLVSAVASVRAQDHGPDELVVVVDHNEALEERARKELDVTVLSNAFARGASGGRNTGANAVQSEILVFLDDDAAAGDERWLSTLLGWYGDQDVVAVGGAAIPAWEGGERPAWFPPSFLWIVGCSYDGQPVEPAVVRNLWACNMSVRRQAFLDVGSFRTEIGGVKGQVTLGCEETELCIRLGHVGRIVYDPRARVNHSVSSGRQTWSYFRRRCWSEGVSKSQVVAAVAEQSAPQTLSVESAYATRVLPLAWWRSVRAAGRRTPGSWGAIGAIPAGLAITSTAYLVGVAKGRAPRKK